ncbi:MAG: hypothetical protein JKY65_22925, partial [Planctomycetes bacterium]|nr:hypothetical protein [Planctomycetota bacterium]
TAATPRPTAAAPAPTVAKKRLTSSKELAAFLDKNRDVLFEQVFHGKFTSLIRQLEQLRPTVQLRARPEIERLVQAIQATQLFAATEVQSDRDSASERLAGLPKGKGKLGKAVNALVNRLRRFVALVSGLRTFALDLSPDRLVNFQNHLLQTQSRAVLSEYAGLMFEDNEKLRNGVKALRTSQRIKDAAREVGHIAQTLCLVTHIERINTWRDSLRSLRQGGFKGEPKLIFEGNEGAEALRSALEAEPRLRWFFRATVLLKTPIRRNSLFRVAIRDVWEPVMQVKALLYGRRDDNLSAVLLKLNENHAGGEFVAKRLQRVGDGEKPTAPLGASGVIVVGDLGQGPLTVYFRKVERSLKLQLEKGNLGVTNIPPPSGGFVQLALEPEASGVWYSQGELRRRYSWKSTKATWSREHGFKLVAVPKGAKALWVLSPTHPRASLEQEAALYKAIQRLAFDPDGDGKADKTEGDQSRRDTPDLSKLARWELMRLGTPEARRELWRRAERKQGRKPRRKKGGRKSRRQQGAGSQR